MKDIKVGGKKGVNGGKTFSVLKFAQENYAHVVYLNFFEDPKLCRAFEGSLKVDEILFSLSLMLDDSAVFVPHETVIVLDEIQECPDARTALKFFHLDGRSYRLFTFPLYLAAWVLCGV